MTDLVLPLTQSEAFERTCSHVGVLVERVSRPASTCLVQSRKLPLIGAFHLVSRGPVSLDYTEASQLLCDVRRRFKGPLVVNAPPDVVPSGGVKIAGGAELASIGLCDAATMRARLHQKWRNQLKKAEGAKLIVTNQALDPKRHAWFLQAEAAQQKARGYKSYPGQFLLAYAAVNKGQARLYSANFDGRPVAGMLVLKHGQMATYQAGVTTQAGRTLCAHNLLLWQVMCDLQKRQIVRLDLGRTDLSAGLRRFKMGSGADAEMLSGSYLFHHRFKPRSQPGQAEESHIGRREYSIRA